MLSGRMPEPIIHTKEWYVHICIVSLRVYQPQPYKFTTVLPSATRCLCVCVCVKETKKTPAVVDIG